MSMAMWLDYPPATQRSGVRIPDRSIFFKFLICLSFWLMAKKLEYPIATQEFAGSNLDGSHIFLNS